MFPQNSKIFLLFFLNLFPDLLFCANSRRIYAYQKEIMRGERRPVPPQNDELVDQTTMVNSQSRKKENNYLICDKGKPIAGICICEQGYLGKYCERKMHCQDYRRAENGSCANCTKNFTGPECDHPICENGGSELKNSQSCECNAPYSGKFCNELRIEDVYYFYNSKAALIGPLGILLIVPMIICFIMSEKHARRRQAGRIQRSWANEQNKTNLDQKRIENLLK